MILRGISVRVEKKDNQNIIGRSPRCVESLFLRNIGSIRLPNVSQINIYLSDNVRAGEIENIGGSLDYYVDFDFALFSNHKKKFNKKEQILSTILSSLQELSNIYNWDFELFKNAYDKCLNQKICNQWFYKNKLFKSPDKKHYAGLFIDYDIDKYEIFIMIFNSLKQELVKTKIFEQESEIFTISVASWKKSNDTFYYKFSGPKKEFSCKVDDLLNGKKYKMPTKTSDYFK